MNNQPSQLLSLNEFSSKLKIEDAVYLEPLPTFSVDESNGELKFCLGRKSEELTSAQKERELIERFLM